MGRQTRATSLMLPTTQSLEQLNINQGPKYVVAGGVSSMGCNPIHNHTSPNLKESRAKRKPPVTRMELLMRHA